MTPTHVTLNINQSQVANLNLGHMIGSIRNRVGGLDDRGLREVALALESVTEAVLENAGLSDSAKRQAIEMTSSIGEEASKGEDERRGSLIRMAGYGMWEVVKNVENLGKLYNGLKSVLKSATGLEIP